MNAWLHRHPIWSLILAVCLGVFTGEMANVASGQAPITPNFIQTLGAALGASPTYSCLGLDANIACTYNAKGTGSHIFQSGGVTTYTLNNTGIVADHVTFFSAVEHCRSDNTTVQMVPTRVAANDWALAVTNAAGSTQNLHCTVILPFRTTAAKGVRIDALSVSYAILTTALTSHTWNALSTVTYANNAANVVANQAGASTCALATAVQANPYLPACVLPTPAFMVTNNIQVDLDFTAVLAVAATTYRVYGFMVGWSEAPL